MTGISRRTSGGKASVPWADLTVLPPLVSAKLEADKRGQLPNESGFWHAEAKYLVLKNPFR